ncbi:DUF2868 domain-containing protein [Halofilum ochraceum]|uniref:DUF2868 domain-containing protein n=1 Tax=Halofilum ochraceum TaxID=1611323 RepID=UPI0008DA7970|nr:DUF2868 domain-containing protein [Halofilum ochraceum]
MPRSETVSIGDWLLAETVRLGEERDGRRRDDHVATRAGASTEAGLARRIALRARALPGADAVRADIARLGRLSRLFAAGLLLLAAATGVLAASASVDARQIDFLLAAAALLLMPTLMLAGWLAVVITGAGRGASGSIAGALLATACRRLGPRVLTSAHAGDVLEAAGGFLRTTPGRWLLGCLAHAFWIAYLLTALVTLVLYFSVVQYDLVWGTTLLNDTTMVTLFNGLADPLVALGLMQPVEPDWLLAAREGTGPGDGRGRWAWFLLAVIGVYGLGPRILGLIASAAAATIGWWRLTLDTAQPGYLRLSGSLAPTTTPESTEQAPARSHRAPRSRPTNPQGRALLVGIELEHEPWPPTIAGIDVQVVGRVDDRAGREQILAALQALDAPPPALLVLCSLLRTPDQGHERFIDRAADAAGTLPLLVLTDGAALTRREGNIDARRADWQALAARVGGKAVEFDPEYPDAAAIAQLQRWIAGHDE